MLSTFLFIVGGIGAVFYVIGGVMMLITIFRTHILWGLACCFLPLAGLIYLFRHWGEVKSAFLMNFIGGTVMVGALFMHPSTQEMMLSGGKESRGFDSLIAAFESGVPKADAATLTQQIDQKRQEIEQKQAALAQSKASLAKLYREISQQKKKLAANNPEAVRAFNSQAAGYSRENTAAKQTQAHLLTLDQELESLLSQRSKLQSSHAPGTGQEVVIYTTSWCPSCVRAKEFLAKRGVHYREVDVESSREANEEFGRYGGNGVPLILVGSRQFRGFNPRALDAAL
jgi:glutaredoxin